MTTENLVRLGMPIAERLATEWGLTLGATFPAATNCLVLEAGEDTVLRIPLEDEEAHSGYQAMLAFSGHGGIQVLKKDPNSRSTLMTRAVPGTMLSDAGLSPREEVRAACQVIRNFPAGPIPEQMNVVDWYEPFLRANHAEAIPDELLRHAQTLAGRLIATMSRRQTVHGDLHHFNLLRHGTGWVAIDPKGVGAEVELEPAAFLRNPCTTIGMVKDLRSLVEVRIKTFAEELGVSAARVRHWGIAQNVLSAWWDGPGERSDTLRVVEAIRIADSE